MEYGRNGDGQESESWRVKYKYIKKRKNNEGEKKSKVSVGGARMAYSPSILVGHGWLIRVPGAHFRTHCTTTVSLRLFRKGYHSCYWTVSPAAIPKSLIVFAHIIFIWIANELRITIPIAIVTRQDEVLQAGESYIGFIHHHSIHSKCAECVFLTDSRLFLSTDCCLFNSLNYTTRGKKKLQSSFLILVCARVHHAERKSTHGGVGVARRAQLPVTNANCHRRVQFNCIS